MGPRKTMTAISCPATTEVTPTTTEDGRAYGAAEERFIGDALFAPHEPPFRLSPPL